MRILDKIFNRLGTDKGSQYGHRHNYSAFYETLLYPLRKEEFNLLEIGIQEGYSVKSWLAYFSKANIYAIDRDDHSNHENILKSNRVKFYYGEASEVDLESSVRFRLIIDDADHGLETQQKLLRKYWHKLENGGFYIIEDLFIGKLPWGVEASQKRCSGFLKYFGHYTAPSVKLSQPSFLPASYCRPLPKFVQDIAFLNQYQLDEDIIDILEQNNHFITVTAISKNGGLHLSLVIFKIVNNK